MRIPVGIFTPEWLLKIGAVFIRTETELILKSRKVFPKRLLDEGFVFEFNEAKDALEDLCRNEARIRQSFTLLH
jgi:NAD dependent epimerase/dehydratase family enzyme